MYGQTDQQHVLAAAYQNSLGAAKASQLPAPTQVDEIARRLSEFCADGKERNDRLQGVIDRLFGSAPTASDGPGNKMVSGAGALGHILDLFTVIDEQNDRTRHLLGRLESIA